MGKEDSVDTPLNVRDSVSGQPAKRRRRSAEVDLLRARALSDDPLSDLSDTDREWVWRSLLKEIRLSQAAQLAGIVTKTGTVDTARVRQALQRVREQYHHRLRAYHDRSDRSLASTPMPVPSVILRQADVMWPLPAAIPSADVSDETDLRFSAPPEGANDVGGSTAAEAARGHRWWPFTHR